MSTIFLLERSPCFSAPSWLPSVAPSRRHLALDGIKSMAKDDDDKGSTTKETLGRGKSRVHSRDLSININAVLSAK